MHAAIRTRGLTKFYGPHRGVEAVDLEVQKGEVFGFLGPNGAGKTTTIRLLLDLLRPTRGTCEIFGLDAQQRSVEVHARIGYVPGELALYDKLSGRELLEFYAALRDNVSWSWIDTLAERFDLDLDRTIADYSTGNRQKLVLVQAMMHRPDLLILDEPTTGLNPLVQQEFYALIAEARTDGGTVFVSSHNLWEVEHMADRVGIIREGRLVVVEQVEALKERALRRLEVHFSVPVPKGAFDGVAGVTDTAIDDTVAHLTVEGSLDGVVKAMARYEVHNVISREADLEDIFLDMYRNGGDADA